MGLPATGGGTCLAPGAGPPGRRPRRNGVRLAAAEAGGDRLVGVRARRPERRGEGIGRALLERVVGLAGERGVERLLGSVAEDDERAVGFAATAGFVEFDREWRSTLDLDAFDPGAWLRVCSPPAAAGTSPPPR